jgi:hypothetical protein
LLSFREITGRNPHPRNHPMKTSFEISRDVPLVHMRQYMAQLGLAEEDFSF